MGNWLSEREQRLVAGAEAASAATPIPTQIVSNGEYLPPPQSATQKRVEARLNEIADANAKRLGLNRRQFFRGEVDKYTWVDVGSSYVPSEICCAFLYAQLEMLEGIAERRRAIYHYYRRQLEPLEAEDEGAIALRDGGDGVAEDAALTDAAEDADEGAGSRREPVGIDATRRAVALPLARDPAERVDVAPRRRVSPGIW